MCYKSQSVDKILFVARTYLAGLYCGGADLCLDRNLTRSLHAALVAVGLTSHISDSLPQLYWNSGLIQRENLTIVITFSIAGTRNSIQF